MFASDCVNCWDDKSVLIVHENADFGRDLLKRLRARQASSHFCGGPAFSAFDSSMDQSITLVIDINMKERHLRLLRRILQSRASAARIFFVNAMAYEKGDWSKIDLYCEMIALKDRLSKTVLVPPEPCHA